MSSRACCAARRRARLQTDRQSATSSYSRTAQRLGPSFRTLGNVWHRKISSGCPSGYGANLEVLQTNTVSTLFASNTISSCYFQPSPRRKGVHARGGSLRSVLPVPPVFSKKNRSRTMARSNGSGRAIKLHGAGKPCDSGVNTVTWKNCGFLNSKVTIARRCNLTSAWSIPRPSKPTIECHSLP